MGKIWIKSPDPSKQCCGCEGKSGPCGSCCSGLAVAIDPLTNGISNNTNINCDFLIDLADPPITLSYRNRPYAVQTFECKVIGSTAETYQLTTNSLSFSTNSTLVGTHGVAFRFNARSGDIISLAASFNKDFENTPALYQSHESNPNNPPFYLENPTTAAYQLFITNLNFTGSFITQDQWANLISTDMNTSNPFVFKNTSFAKVNSASNEYGVFQDNYLCAGSSTGCRIYGDRFRCQTDGDSLFNTIGKRQVDGTFQIVRNYTCQNGTLVGNFSDNIEDYIAQVTQDFLDNSPTTAAQKFLCAEEELSKPYDILTCNGDGPQSDTITANYHLYWSTNWPNTIPSLPLSSNLSFELTKNACLHFEITNGVETSGFYRDVIHTTPDGQTFTTFKYFNNVLSHTLGSSNALSMIPLAFYSTAYNDPIPNENLLPCPTDALP